MRSWAYPWRQLITFWIPNFFGNPSHHSYFDWFRFKTIITENPLSWGVKNFVEAGSYLGILPLVLAFSAVLPFHHKTGPTPKRSEPGWNNRILFLSTSFLSFCFIFGTPLYGLIYYLPGMSQVHSPFRWSLILTFSIAVLAGYGTQNLQERPPAGGISKKRFFFRDPSYQNRPPLAFDLLRIIIFWGGGFTILALLFGRLFFSRIQPVFNWILAHSRSAGTVFPDAQAFFSYEFPWLFISGLLLMTSALVIKLRKTKYFTLPFWGRIPLWEPLVFLIIVFDLNFFVWGFYPAIDIKLLESRPPVIDFLKADNTLWRLTTFDPKDRKTLNANAGWLFALQDVRGYDSIFSAQYKDYMSLLDTQDQLLYNRIAPLRHKESLESPLLDLLNVKYVLTEEVIKSPKFRLVWQNSTLRVYQNLSCIPRAFSLPFSCLSRTSQLKKALQLEEVRNKIVLDNPNGISPISDNHSSGCQRGSVDILSYESNRVGLSLKLREPSWLVLLDSYSPGWRVYVRPGDTPAVSEKEIRIVRAYKNFRAVPLNPGHWNVRFVYRPLSFIIGGIISILGGFGLLILIAIPFPRRWKSIHRSKP